MVGKIDGGSKLRLGPVKSQVWFKSKIDGKSTVEVSALPRGVLVEIDAVALVG